MREFFARFHPDFPPTRLWGYDARFPGPTFQALRGNGLLVEWVNGLPSEHLLSIDHSVHGAGIDLPAVRTVVHLHGAKVQPDSDGYPEEWFTPGASAVNYYPNRQDAAMLWYHDHALGITRLNIYAGLLGAFFVRDELETALNLPKGGYEIPLIICDRDLDEAGQLFYGESPHSKATWIPEFYGNVWLVNGKFTPFLEVRPRKYRFRIVNVSNSRFFRLMLSGDIAFTQIGCDQGLLPAPVVTTSVELAPAERVDIVVDFHAMRGQNIELRGNQSPILQFRVSETKVRDTSSVPAVLRPRGNIGPAIKTRILTLDEERDRSGRVTKMLLNKTPWHMPVTENPTIDTVEVWSLVNLTPDTHPIHLHLVRFLILDRRYFSVDTYKSSGQLELTSPAIPPDPSEAGWKDTVRASRGQVTRIMMRFEGFTGRYVWHCHILEHEDNEMMRPYEILPAGRARTSSVAPSEEWCRGSEVENLVK